MKITGVTPLFVDRFLFVRVTTDNGLSGIGESGAWGHLEASAEAIRNTAHDAERALGQAATSSSEAIRSATVRAAIRRGCVWAIMPSIPRPSSRQILGSWVVLPEPVSPATTTTWCSPTIRSSSSRCALTGSASGYEIAGSVFTEPTIGGRGPLSALRYPLSG